MEQRPLHIFISYRRIHNGAPCAFILAERLEALGIEVFYDNHTLHDFNSNYKDIIHRDIEKSDYVLVLLQKGCMKEKRGDIYLDEIRHAIDKLGMDRILLLPLDEQFQWEKEAVPQDLKHLPDHNNLDPLRLADVDATISNILNRCKCRPELSCYTMLHRQRTAALSSGCRAIVQRTGDIYSIDPSERWRFATRISLLSIGLGALTGVLSSDVEEKYKEGVSFRLMSVDPDGESAKDTIGSKLNSRSPKMHSEYLQKCRMIAQDMFDSIAKENAGLRNDVEYRVTTHHLTCSIQIVEHENPAYDYVFVEYYGIWATGEKQGENRAIIAYRNDPNYAYYCKQFDKVWKAAHLAYKKDIGETKNEL